MAFLNLAGLGVFTGRKARPLSREEKAIERVAEAIRAGVIVHFTGSAGSGTVGPYHAAVDPRPGYGTARRFAVHLYHWRQPDYTYRNESREFETAEQAAGFVLARLGVGYVIAALKATANDQRSRYHGADRVVYTNLDTPIPWIDPRTRGQR